MKSTNQTNKNKKSLLGVKIVFIMLIMMLASIALIACPSDTGIGVDGITISVYQAPTRLEYVVGQNLDLAGGQIQVRDRNGEIVETRPMTGVGVEVSHTRLDTVGNTIITVTFQGATTSFTVTVRPNTTAMSIDTLPTTSTVIIGTPFSLAGGYVTLTNQGSADERVSMLSPRLQIPHISTDVAGTVPVTIRLVANPDISTTFNITVSPVAVASITNFTPPANVTRHVGQALVPFTSAEGGTIEAVFNDGTTRTISMNNASELNRYFTISGFASIPGSRTVKITANGNPEVYEEFTVTVNPATPTGLSVAPSGIVAIQGYNINFGTTEVTITYTVGTSTLTAVERLSNTYAFTVTGFNSGVAGNQTLTVTLNYDAEEPISTTFVVNVVANAVTNMEIVTFPTRRVYHRLEEIDYADGTIRVTFASGRVEIRPMDDPMFTRTGGTGVEGGSITIRIIAGTREVAFTISVGANPVTGIEIATLPRYASEHLAHIDSSLMLDGGVVRVVLTHPAGNPASENFSMTTTQFTNAFTVRTSDFTAIPTAGAAQTQNIRITHNASSQFTYLPIMVLLPTIALEAPTRTQYSTGEALDLTGMSFEIVFTHPSADVDDFIVPDEWFTHQTMRQFFTDLRIEGFDSFPEATGQQTIKLLWYRANVYSSFAVTVTARTITNMEVIRLPGSWSSDEDDADREWLANVLYSIGHQVNFGGGKIRITYSDGHFVDTYMTSGVFRVYSGTTWTAQGGHRLNYTGVQTIMLAHINEDLDFKIPFHVFVFSENPTALAASLLRAMTFPWLQRTTQNHARVLNQFNHYLDAAHLAMYWHRMQYFIETYSNFDLKVERVNSRFCIVEEVVNFLQYRFFLGEVIVATGANAQGQVTNVMPAYIADILFMVQGGYNDEDVFVMGHYARRVTYWLERGNEELEEFWKYYLATIYTFNNFSGNIFSTQPLFGMTMWERFLELELENQFYFLNLIHSVRGFELSFFTVNNQNQITGINTVLGSPVWNEFAFILHSNVHYAWPVATNAQGQAVASQSDAIRNGFIELMISTEFLIVYLYWEAHGPRHLNFETEPTEEQIEAVMGDFLLGLRIHLLDLNIRFTSRNAQGQEINGGQVNVGTTQQPRGLWVMTIVQRQTFGTRFGDHFNFLAQEFNRLHPPTGSSEN
ncbi:MAG: bacterial Ig-like domain-containing protein [Firmicutes bacterium]|nr:bacterial Ig-like domain-containing protein [Bacillota bacterium]